MPRTIDPDVEKARKRFKLLEESTKNQRARELSDLAYYAGEMWSQEQLDARAAQPATADGLPPVPARPSYTIRLVKEPVQQVLNAERAADFGIELTPADDFASLVGPMDATEIELREGLTRRIQRDSEASDARIWAGARAAICGTGYYAVLTRYVKGKTFDQEVYVHRYYNQSSVGLDPTHEQPDGSDAKWAFGGGVQMLWDEYEAEYPRNAKDHPNPLSGCSVDEFRMLGDEAPGWFVTEGDQRIVRIVDYLYTVYKPRTLVQLASDGSIWWKDELPKDVTGPFNDERRVIDTQIKWCKIDGIQKLDETDWPSPEMPIIKVLGEELQPYDQERRSEGMVRPGRDSNMGFNAMLSKGVELIGLAPIPPFQATISQVEGFEKWYQVANTRTLPYLPYNAVSDNGQPLGPPTRTNVDTPIAAVATFLQVFRDTLQSTTGIHDPQLGKVDPSVKSGRAIRALQEQSQHGTSNYSDNLRRAVQREAKIINSLLYPIYGRSGRIARILNKLGDVETVFVNGRPPQMAQMPPDQQPKGMPTKEYKLTPDAKCNVAIKVGRAFDTRRGEEAAVLADLFAANPLFMTWYGDLYFKNSDMPGHLELAERAKVMLDPKIQQMMAAKQNGEQIPPEVQMQMQQMQQRLSDAERVMQTMNQEIVSKKAENDVKLQITQMEIASKERIAAADRETKITVAELAAKVDRMELFLEERARLGLQAHEHIQGELDRQHEREMSLQGQAHEVASGAMEQQATADQANAQRQHEMAMTPPAPEGEPTT